MVGKTLTKAQLAKFAREVLRNLWDGFDMDGGDIQEAAERHGLITCVPFDPEVHTDQLGLSLYPGDDWYEEHPDLAKLSAGRTALQEQSQ